ncbi:MAG TPA: hypothetical protein VFA71_05380 [Terriglobales bacterium]|nr:hypothetical protein [Terriglobales bacterium]
MTKWIPWKKLGILVEFAVVIAALSCGTGTNFSPPKPNPIPISNPAPNPTPTPTPSVLCNCTPLEPDSADYRHNAKHVPLPGDTPQEITVATILGWQQSSPAPAFDAPRSGRELQLFHISLAYLQSAAVEPGDCDIHMELSDVPDKTAPRVIVETPVDSEYCPARGQIQAQLAQHGFTLTQSQGGELPQALAVSVQGLAFEDFPHKRGSQYVATAWELHPAIVSVNP